MNHARIDTLDGNNQMLQARRSRSTLASASIIALIICGARPAYAWDEKGHSIVVDAALARLGDDMPDFVRTNSAAARLRYLASEPDRWRNMKMPPMDQLNGPDHYFDLELIEPYGLTPQTMPPLRYDFIRKIVEHTAKSSARNANAEADADIKWPGFAPYRICELYVQLKSSWRTLNTYEKYRSIATPAELQAARDNVVYLMGIMSHYVADVAQPLHTTVHYDGWTGDNPNEYVTRKNYIHKLIDGGVIREAGIEADQLPGNIPIPKIDEGQLFQQVMAFVVASNTLVDRIYELEKAGAFGPGNEQYAEATDFIRQRLADGAAFQAALWQTAASDAGLDEFRVKRFEALQNAGSGPD